jgi:hypothetical protein
VNVASPQQYRIGLWYATEQLPSRTLRARFWVREVGGGSTALDYGTLSFATISGDQDWTYAEVIFTLDPAVHTHPELLYDGIRVRIETSSAHTGALGIDDVSIQEVGDPTELAANQSFSEGHEQVSAGDHASNFLSRLNGVAFFGSLSHHQSGGHSFERHPQETLLYFLRGLPLGDAVWWAEGYNSGILYGDPLYSPTAVRLEYLNAQDRILDSTVPLYGSTMNGRDPQEVETEYEVDYCQGADFYECDRNSSWVATPLQGVGGERLQLLGLWDTSGLSHGEYTLRLRVTSMHLPTGESQSFYDYYPVTVGFPLPEVTNLTVDAGEPTRLSWDSQGLVLYDLVSGDPHELAADGGFARAQCLFDNTYQTEHFDSRAPPPPGQGYYYLVRAQFGADSGSYGDGRSDGPDPRNELDLFGPCP